MGWTLKKIILVSAGTAAGAGVCFLTAGIAAPAIGAMLGSTLGLSGAAATSAGLATLGGGAIAAGGGGMAAGAALVTTYMTSAGAILGALGMGTAANFFKDSNKDFEKALNVEKNFAKAQQIILDQEAKIRNLQGNLNKEKQAQQRNQSKITQLEKAIDELIKMVNQNKTRFKSASAA